MDPLSSQVLQLLKQAPARVLVIGGFAFEADLLSRERTVELPSLEAAVEAAEKTDGSDGEPFGEPFDTVLWRAEALSLDAGLEIFHRLLAPRGRLIAVMTYGARKAVLLALLEKGFVHLEEHEIPLPTSKVCLIALRRENFPVRALAAGEASGAEKDILELFTPSFHVQRSVEHWRWKYESNPWGRRNITVAYGPDGGLAAHYAGYPLPLVLSDGEDGPRRDLLAMQIGDTMTEPRFRQVGRGPTSLLGRCIRHYYTAFCENRVAFNFGFNTGNIQKFSMLFAGAHRIEPVGFWVRPAAPPPEPAGYKVERVHKVGAAFDRFFDRVAPFYGLLVRRDADFLRWRYLDCPDDPPFVILAVRRYFRLVGYAVFRRRGDRLMWADSLFHPRHLRAAADLLRHALALPEHQGVEAVEAWFPPRPGWFWPYLSTLGFSARPEPNDLALMLVPHLEKNAPDLLRERFYYTLGDGDLV